jgi:hypothetical protein
VVAVSATKDPSGLGTIHAPITRPALQLLLNAPGLHLALLLFLRT